MPELPEVEHLRRTLARALRARRVTSAALHRDDVCETDHGRAPTAPDLLVGGLFESALRRGKHLAITVEDGRVLCVHLGMSGQLLLVRDGRTPARADHIHASWTLDDGSRLLFRDPRRFGGLRTFADLEGVRVAIWSRLGPDAWTIQGPVLRARLGNSRRCIKAALLDQAVLAGVGNIYADEALFMASLNPRRLARSLTPADCDRLADALRETLTAAVQARGSTLRDYVDSEGRPGTAQVLHKVYGRAGQPCPRCSRTLRAIDLGQRTTVYCTRCQGGRRRPRYPQPPRASSRPAAAHAG